MAREHLDDSVGPVVVEGSHVAPGDDDLDPGPDDSGGDTSSDSEDAVEPEEIALDRLWALSTGFGHGRG